MLRYIQYASPTDHIVSITVKTVRWMFVRIFSITNINRVNNFGPSHGRIFNVTLPLCTRFKNELGDICAANESIGCAQLTFCFYAFVWYVCTKQASGMLLPKGDICEPNVIYHFPVHHATDLDRCNHSTWYEHDALKYLFCYRQRKFEFCQTGWKTARKMLWVG